jgi:enoyl-CoA hydratase
MENSRNEPSVLAEASDGVLVITINRPHRRNALTADVATGLRAALARLDDSPDLHAGVITGAGDHFCAGMDLRDTPLDEDIDDFERDFQAILANPCDKPLIAAIEGYAVAGGWELAMACDLIVAGAGARFGLPEVKVGLVAQGGALLWLPRRIPYHLAMELCLTGRLIDAGRVEEIGGLNDLVPDGSALARATELAAEIAANAPLAVVATKKVVKRSHAWPEEEEWQRQEELAMPVFHSADAAEGAAAFAAKRPPRWEGR